MTIYIENMARKMVVTDALKDIGTLPTKVELDEVELEEEDIYKVKGRIQSQLCRYGLIPLNHRTGSCPPSGG